MNKLDDAKRAMMVRALCEGNSLRAVARMGGMSFNTVVKLLIDLGEACEWYQDKHLTNLSCTEVQMDEIWSFVGCKEKNKADAINDHPGDVWTWTALCPNTKLMVGWMVGDRDAAAANAFCCDIGKRFAGHIQVTTDGHAPYRFAVGLGFGDADFAQLVKIYGKDKKGNDVCVGAKKVRRFGNPDMSKVSTSLVERQNLTMRMSMRRFTRLTNGHSKKIENHCHAVALHFMHYNFCRKHLTLKTTPAVAAGVADKPWTIEDLLAMFDAYRAEFHPVNRPKKYKPRRETPKSYEPTPKDEIPEPWYLNPNGTPPEKNSN